MSKKTSKILVIVILIIVGIGTLFLYFASQKAPIPGEEPAPREFLPFGRAPEKEIPPVIEIEEKEVVVEIPEEEIVISKLQKISTFAIAGAVVFQKEREIESIGQEQETVKLFDFSVYPTLRIGNSSIEVEDLQIVLNRFLDQETGTEDIGQETLEVSGEFDGATKDAVKEFQREKGLSADGIAGPKTFTALNEFQGITAPLIEMVAAVRYVKKSSAHIYETFLDNIIEKKISNTTIPGLHEAFFGNSNESVILRYLADDNQTIESFSGALSPEEEGILQELIGGFLAQNISDISVSPDGEKIFYLEEINEEAIGTTASFNGTSRGQIFSSPFTEWFSQWVNERTIALNTKPSAVAAGFLYTLDTKTGAFNRVLGNIDGLTTLMSHDGKFVLLSQSADKSIKTLLYDIKERSTIDMDIKTLSEKCVWSKKNESVYCAVPKSIEDDFYPDVWYQGLVSFSDNIWKINTKTNISNLLADPEREAGESIDAINLSLDENEEYLIFTNKKDSFLWSLKID